MRSKLFAILIFSASFICAPLVLIGAVASTTAAQQRKQSAATYVCPMHPEVRRGRPGRCPKCGMNLKPETKTETPKSNPSAPTADNSQSAPAQPQQGINENLKLRIPDTTVLDQDGRRLRFYSDLVKGKTVAINFIFTTCTTICPPLTATFRKVQQNLAQQMGREVSLISISVDPATDVPERLKAFSQKFQAGPGWTFVTGSKPEIDELLRALGGFVSDKNDHTPLVLVGNDAAGFWTRTYGLAPASQISNLLKEAAARGPAAGVAGNNSNSTNGATGASASEAASHYFPNLTLLTQENKPVRFYSDLLKGKVVLINFLFTNCKGVCSPMTANLAKVQQYLGERVGREVLMLSISVDPLVDTPAVLKRYADSFKVGPGWYFLTGEKQNVDWVLYKLGGYVEDRQQHSSVLIIGKEATGEWMKVPAMTNPTEIAEAVNSLLKPEGATN